MARDAGNSLHWEDPSSPHKKSPSTTVLEKRSPPSKSSAGRGNTHAWSLLLHLCEVGAGRRAGYPSEHARTSHTLCALLKGAHPPIRVTRTHHTRIASFPRTHTHTHRPSCCLEHVTVPSVASPRFPNSLPTFLGYPMIRGLQS